jgi:hypothetical protein
MLATSETEAGLRELVREHQIRWKAGREEAVVDGELRTIGLKLELSAVHAHLVRRPMPGCPECRPVVSALEKVIDAVLPKEHRRSFYEVTLPTAELGYSPSGTAEITATIAILHKGSINDPVDACETRCLREMTEKLKALGAKEGRR